MSTLGAGIELGYRPSNALGLRVGGNFLDLGFDRTIDSTPYHFDGHLRSGGAVLDYYPFQTGFRLTAGVRINGNDATATSTPTGDITVGGTTLTPAEIGTLNGKVSFNTVVPTVGFGYSAKVAERIELGLDLGVMYEGHPKVSLSATSPAAASPTVQNALATESGDIRHKLNFLTWYPVLTLSAKYCF